MRRVRRGARAIAAWGVRCAVVVLVCGIAMGGDEHDRSAALEADPDVLSGSLSNGVSYMVVPRWGGASRGIAVRVRIGAGTLDEGDDQIGAAHIVGRMVFTKSEHFKEGEARQRFGSHGMAFDRFRNIATRHSETVYSFNVADAQGGALDLVLRIGADAVGGVVFDERTIEAQRRLSIEDARLYRDAARSARTGLFERLAPGSGLGERTTLVAPEILGAVSVGALRAYHRDHFTPGRTTVVVVGEIDGEEAVRAIAGAFGGLKARKNKQDRGRWRVPEQMHERAVASAIAGEPEVTAEVLIADEPPAAVRTARAFERSVVRDLAIEAMRTRLRRGVLDGSIGAREVAANAWNFAGAARITGVSAVTTADGWDEAVRVLNSEVERVGRYGFDPIDTTGARARVVALSRRGARSARSWSNNSVAGRLLERVRTGSTVQSVQREYELTARIAELTSDEEISDAFRAMFPSGAWCTVVLGPPGTTPSEDEVARVASGAYDGESLAVEAIAEPLPTIVAGDAVRGAIRSVEYDPASGVTSAVFANGVIVHHKKVDSAVNRIAIGVALAGGRPQETQESRGLTSAVASVWDAPVWCGTSVAAVNTVLAGRDIEFEGSVLDDSMQVAASCDPVEIDAALGVIASTIREPLVEAGALQRWKEKIRSDAARRWGAPGQMIGDVFARATRPAGDPRYGELDGSDADRVTVDAAQRWAEDFMDSAPIEASIVGDIERKDAFEAASKTLGALAMRGRIDVVGESVRDNGETTLGSIEVHTVCDPETEHAIVLIGYRGVAYTNRERVHLLGVVRHAWQDRLMVLLQEEEQVASWIGCGVAPGITNDGDGMLWAAAAVAPEEIDRVGGIMLDALHEMRDKGIEAQHLDSARQRTLTGVRSIVEDPMHLALLSCDMRYRGVAVADELRAEETVQSCDAWGVKTLLDEVVAADRRVVLSVRPGDNGRGR